MRMWREIRNVAVIGWLSLFTLSPFDASAGNLSDELIDIRPYLNFHGGKALFVEPDAVPNAELASPQTETAFGAAAGADIGRHAGIELAFDYNKTELLKTSGAQAADYSLATLLIQMRLRYPLLQDRLVPYFLIGGGMGFGEFSGREDFDYPGSGRDFAPLGTVGIGAEYFVSDNIAFGVEAKHYFLFHPDFNLEGQRRELTADNVGITGNMRVYLDSLGRGHHAQSASESPAKDSDAMRGYLGLRAGKAFYTDTHAAPGVDIKDTSGILGGGALGLNLNKYLGTEVSLDFARSQLTMPNIGKVTGYPVWTIAALGRLRYPLFEDRLTPYLLTGAGIGFGEAGDPDRRDATALFSGKTDYSLVGVFGGGLEYFVEENVALGIEAKYTTFFDTDVMVRGQPATLSPEYVSLTGGIRVFYP
jgi:opacity protein-like surface antigen